MWIGSGGRRVGLQQPTFDPVGDALAATAREQLAERPRHVLVISRGVRDTLGRQIAAAVRVPFTTMSGTGELDRMRTSLDDGSAYRAAGIADEGSRWVSTPPVTGGRVGVIVVMSVLVARTSRAGTVRPAVGQDRDGACRRRLLLGHVRRAGRATWSPARPKDHLQGNP